MDMMLIAIAAVVIIVIIAGVVMMKKKSSNADTSITAQKPTNRPKTLAEQQRERELQNQATTNIPTNISPTPTTQTAVPTSTHVPTSPTTVDTPSSLSMAGVAVPVAVAATAVTATAAHAMSEPTTTTPPKSVSGTDSIDFDDFDIFKEDNKPATEVSQPTTLSTTSVAPVQPTVSSASQPATDELAFDFDLEHNTSTSPTPSASSLSTTEHEVTSDDAFLSLETHDDTNDDIHFDLSDTLTQETKPILTAAEPAIAHSATTVADDSFDFDDIDLELPMLAGASNPSTDITAKAELTHTAPVSTPTVPAKEDFSEFEDFGEFDLALDTPAKSSLTSTIEPITPTPELSTDDIIKDTTAKNEAVMLGDDDFNFDLDDSLFAKDTASTTAPAMDGDIKSHTDKTSAEPSMVSDEVDSTFDQLDAFYAPTHTEDKSEAAPVFIPEATSQPAIPADTHAPVIAAAPLVAPTAPVVTEDFSQAFDVIKGMDSQQVTLELAEQYIQLGEYDSAKRLLSELSTAAPTVQQNASRLLASLE